MSGRKGDRNKMATKMTTRSRTQQDHHGNSRTFPEDDGEQDAEGGATGDGSPGSEVGGTMLLKAMSLMQSSRVVLPQTVVSWNQTFQAFLLKPQLRGVERQGNDPTLELRRRNLQPSVATWHEGNRGRQLQTCLTPNCTTAPLLMTSRNCHATPDGPTAPLQVTFEKGIL